MNIRAAPIIGIPLPLVSYGGSFVVGSLSVDDSVGTAHATIRPALGTSLPVTLDGKRILRNYWDYWYDGIYFPEPIPYAAPTDYGSIAAIERLIQTVKRALRLLPLVPLRREAFREEIGLALDWYNEHRPHSGLGGRTPNEVYFHRRPAHREPRFETRSRWPRGLPCAEPWALVKGRPGARIALDVNFYASRKHLPLVTLRRVA